MYLDTRCCFKRTEAHSFANTPLSSAADLRLLVCSMSQVVNSSPIRLFITTLIVHHSTFMAFTPASSHLVEAFYFNNTKQKWKQISRLVFFMLVVHFHVSSEHHVLRERANCMIQDYQFCLPVTSHALSAFG